MSKLVRWFANFLSFNNIDIKKNILCLSSFWDIKDYDKISWQVSIEQQLLLLGNCYDR